MATSSIRLTHYCYSCERHISPDLINATLTCPNCNTGFVEEMEQEEQALNLSRSAVYEFMQNLLQLPGSSITNSDDNEYVFVNGNSGQDEPVAANTRSRRRTPDMFNSTFRADRLLQFMLFSDIPIPFMTVGPPPATSSDIAQLPKTILTPADLPKYETCSICYENYAVNDTAIRLPCHHVFHESCIETWLKQHGTCPICRKDLQGRDTSQDHPTNGQGGSNDRPMNMSVFFE